MKTRILSLLLLVVMLVTAIPVATASAEAAVPASTVDYTTLYAKQENLTALYSAMTDTTGINMTAGTWSSLVGSGKITLGNFSNDKVNWKNEHQSVGVVSTWGYYDQANNKFYIGTETEEDGTTLTAGAQIALKYNNNDIFNTQLTFGISQLPADDYTLEYVANFGYTMMVDANGTPFINGIDVPGALDTHSYSKRYNADGTSNNSYGYGGGHYQGSVDFIGAANSVTGYRDAYFTDNPSYYGYTRGKVFWFFVNAGYAPMWNATQSGYPGRILSVKGDDWQTRDQIRTYTMTRDEFDGFKADGATANRNATYSFIRDGVVYQSYTDNFNNYTGADYGGTFFYLGNRCTVDYYTVRIYNAVLTDADIAQNRAVDIMLYYDLTVTDELCKDATKWADVVADLSSGAFETDASLIASKKAQYQAAVNDTAYAERRAEIVSLYAAQENLTALYTADEIGGVDLVNGTWSSLVGSGKISLGNYNNDKVNWTWENKSVGVVQTWGSYIDGVFSENSETALRYNNNDINHTKLDLGISQLPTGDYTVEYVAKYGHVMSVDATGKPVQVNIELADVVAAGTHSYKSEWYYDSYDDNVRGGWGAGAYDFLGFIQNVGQPKSDDNNYAGNTGYYGTGYGRSTWYIGFQYWWQISGQGGMFPLDTYARNNQWNDRTQIMSYTITRSVAEGTHSYNLLRNGTTYLTNSKSTTENERSGRFDFFLGNRITGNYYGIRIYNKVLSADEMAQNRAADIIVYYGLDVKDEWRNDEAKWAAVIDALSSATIVAGNADTIASKKAEYQAAVNETFYPERREEILSLYAAKENLTALYTAEEVGKVDLAKGTWTSLVGSGKITLGNYNNDKVNWTWENKSVGVIQTWGSYIDGVFSENSATALLYNNNDINHTKLDFGISQLPTGDYTVEYVAKYGHVMSVDATGKPVQVNIELADVAAAGTHSYNSPWYYGSSDGETATGGWAAGAYDSLGFIQALGQKQSDHNNWAGAASTYGYGYGRGVWFFGDQWWWAITSQAAQRGWGCFPISSYVLQNQWHDRTQIMSYTITRSVEESTHSFALLRNGETYQSSSYTTTANERNGYFDFFLGNRITGNYYGIRIYNKVLSADEMAQNHFADLLIYHDVVIPEGFTENMDAATSLFAEHRATNISADASVTATTKATLQNAVNNFKKSVNITIDGVTESMDIFGESEYTLPSTVASGALVLGWKVNGEDKAIGDVVTLENGMTMEPTVFHAPVTVQTPSVKVTAKAEDLGMRFTATINKAEFDALVAIYGEENVSYGILIAPDAYVQMAGGVFTREALDALDTQNGGYVQIEAGAFYTTTDTLYTVAGSLYNFSETTRQKNPAFAAVAYVDIDTNNDNLADINVYGNYNAATSTTVVGAMQNAANSQEGLTNTQKSWILDLLALFANK